MGFGHMGWWRLKEVRFKVEKISKDKNPKKAGIYSSFMTLWIRPKKTWLLANPLENRMLNNIDRELNERC